MLFIIGCSHSALKKDQLLIAVRGPSVARVTVQSLRRPDDGLQGVHKTFRVKLHLLGTVVDLGINLNHVSASKTNHEEEKE